MWIRRVGASVRSVAYAPNGGTVYTSEGGRITAWDMASREPTRLFRTDQLATPAYAYGLHPVGDRYLLIESYQHWAAWDMEDKKEVAGAKLGRWCRPVGPTSTAFRFVSTGGLIRAHDLATGKTTTVLHKPDKMKKLAKFAFSPDDRLALVLDEYHSGALVTLATGKSVSVTRPEGGYGHDIIQFAANGSLVWCIGNRIHVCNPTNPNKRIASYPAHWPYGTFALHPNAPVFAALNRDQNLTLFSLETGAELRTFALELGRWVRSVCFSPDGLTCAVGGSNKQFAVFDVDV
jgi:WD40 repeat protein